MCSLHHEIEAARTSTASPHVDPIIAWIARPARWWQFWLPQSGIAGGAIIGAIMTVVAVAIALVAL